MEGIIHIRIDDRLIHGQVATQWTNDLGATRIMAINDEVATNPTLKTVLRMAAPPNVSTSIITRETAVTNIKAGKYGRNFSVLCSYSAWNWAYNAVFGILCIRRNQVWRQL